MFYERLTKLCGDKGITVSALLSQLKMSTGNNKKWKDGITPSYEALQKIADYFNVSVDYLLGRDEIKNRSVSEEIERIMKLMEDSEDFKKYVEVYLQLSPEGRKKLGAFLDLVSPPDTSSKD